MPVSVIANRTYDVGVTRDSNADINKNTYDDNTITDIGVVIVTASDSNPKDLASMPVSKTRKDKDGPVPYNAKTGNTNVYQR